MTNKEMEVLEKIVELKGNCLTATLCESCPFRLECLPPFIIPDQTPPSEAKRCKMALSALSNKVFEETV